MLKTKGAGNNPETKSKDIIIVIPSYNETGNISSLLRETFSHNPDFSILVVDDNSPDGTYAEVKGLQDEYPKLHLVVRADKLGLGSAYIEGFRRALEGGYNIIVQMDADLSHRPSYLPPMISLLQECDMVVGSRYARGGGISHWAFGRVLLSRFANAFAKVLLGGPVDDMTSGFKCIKAEVLRRIDFDKIASRGYAFQIELIFRSYMEGFKITEYPIIFEGRRHDRSKMSLAIAIEAFFRVISLSVKRLLRRCCKNDN